MLCVLTCCAVADTPQFVCGLSPASQAQAINKSLSALGDVIMNRAQKAAHVPFRNSTLTHLLQVGLPPCLLAY